MLETGVSITFLTNLRTLILQNGRMSVVGAISGNKRIEFVDFVVVNNVRLCICQARNDKKRAALEADVGVRMGFGHVYCVNGVVIVGFYF